MRAQMCWWNKQLWNPRKLTPKGHQLGLASPSVSEQTCPLFSSKQLPKLGSASIWMEEWRGHPLCRMLANLRGFQSHVHLLYASVWACCLFYIMPHSWRGGAARGGGDAARIWPLTRTVSCRPLGLLATGTVDSPITQYLAPCFCAKVPQSPPH